MPATRSRSLALAAVIFAGLACAQSDLFEKAPPGVEDALRARVDRFYQLWVDGKFREAEKLVAADSQEAYYQMAKRRYEGCKIMRIRYEQEFTWAVVTVECRGTWNIQGSDVKTGMAQAYMWKLENDEWRWTVKRPKTVESPFGVMSYGSISDASKMFNQETGMPKDVAGLGRALLNQVRIDKPEVRLSSYEKASAVVTLHNGLNGEIDVRADPDGVPPGFVAKFDITKVPANSDAHLTLSYEPRDKSPKSFAKVRITVEQTNQIFDINLTFAIPPEVERELEKMRTGK
jgi:hypothetical protein